MLFVVNSVKLHLTAIIITLYEHKYLNNHSEACHFINGNFFSSKAFSY